MDAASGRLLTLRVLLCEDDPLDAELVLAELHRTGRWAVEHRRVQTPEDLTAALNGAPWDLIVSDYYMPHLRAEDILKAVGEHGMDTPVILVSGGVGEEAAVALMRAGACDFVMKDRLARLAPAVERSLEAAAACRARDSSENALRDSEHRAREMLREQAALRRVATSVAAQSDPVAVFALAAKEAAQLLGADGAMVARFDGMWASVVGSSAPAERTDHRERMLLAGSELLRRLSAGGGALREDGYTPAPTERLALWTAGRAHGVAAAPILVRERVWGAVVAMVPAARPLPTAAEEQLAGLAGLVSMAIAQMENRQIGGAAVARLGDNHRMEALVEAIAQAAERALGALSVTLITLSDDGTVVTGAWSSDTSPAGHDRAAALVGHPPPSSGEGTVIAPLGDPARATRAILVTLPPGRRPDAGDAPALAGIAHGADLALDAAVRCAAFESDAERTPARADIDALTGLATDGLFWARLRDNVARATAAGEDLALALIDVDGMARFNAENGYGAGDDALRNLALTLQACAQPGDVLARVGGQRFAWILPGRHGMAAWEVVEHMRSALSPDAPGEQGITVSAGIADIRQGSTIDQLVALAGGARHWAKQSGRDTVFLYHPDVVTSLSPDETIAQLRASRALVGVRVLARAVDAKDATTQQHSERVAATAVGIATALGWPAHRAALLHDAGLVHDVGKIGVRDAVLFKVERLTDAEYDEIKRHAALGAEIVDEALTPEQVSWVRGHHERWDGTGYPDGLRGEQIPEGARILALADAWDAMTAARHYSPSLRAAEALDECRREAGRQFWGDGVDALIALIAADVVPVDE